MVQLLSFIPLLNLSIPSVLATFINNYLSVTAITFPFTLIPFNFINPLFWLSYFATPPFNSKFIDGGYYAVSFIYNFADQFFTWISLLLLYFLLIFLTKVLKGKRYLFVIYYLVNSWEFIEKWKEEYVYNTPIRVLIECFVQLTFCALLNISEVINTT